MPRLRIKFQEAVIKEIGLDDAEAALSVGRKPDNDIVVDNAAVSGHHCKIVRKGGTWYVEDLESTNGTYVNGEKVVKAGLRDGDVVGIAKHEIHFIGDAPAAAPAAGAALPEGAPPAGGEKREATFPSGEAFAAAFGGSVNEKDPTLTPQTPADAEPGAVLKVLKGGVGDVESYRLTGSSTYLGGSERAMVRIAGGGLLSKAPDIAASINRRPEGWVLNAVAEGYPKVNGAAVAKKIRLNRGDIIECGGTTLQFELEKS